MCGAFGVPENILVDQTAAFATRDELATEQTDNIVIFQLRYLQPGETYIYRTNSSHEGGFQTPVAHTKRWTMLSTSRHMPRWPYSPFDHPYGFEAWSISTLS
jgi:hypothetical protein